MNPENAAKDVPVTPAVTPAMMPPKRFLLIYNPANFTINDIGRIESECLADQNARILALPCMTTAVDLIYDLYDLEDISVRRSGR